MNVEGQAAAYPIASFLPPPPGAKDPEGWQYATGGVPAVAALVADLNGDGVPEVLLPIAAFAGPGGPHLDRVYVVGPAGCVTIVVLK